MNKEEKQSIENLIKEYEIQTNEYKVELLPLTFDKETYLSLKAVLNYIDKLQKENEEFQKANKMLNDFIISNQLECISKDKIRDKIKEVAEEPQIYVDTEKFDKEFEKSIYIIKVLKELLERE